MTDSKTDKSFDEAMEWLLLLNQDGVEELTEVNFKAWLKQDTLNLTHFKQVIDVYQLSGFLECDLLKYVDDF